MKAMPTAGETMNNQIPPSVIPIDQEAQKKIRAIKEHVLTTARILMDDVRVEISEESRGGYELKAPQVPLDHYVRSRVIQTEEYRAGNRLFRDFYLSGQNSILTANLNPIRSDHQKAYLPATELQREALNNWRKALSSIHGKIGQLMALNVCCYGYWLNDIKYMHYNERTSTPRFREALNDLIEFYKTI
jgi:hypothetical protein